MTALRASRAAGLTGQVDFAISSVRTHPQGDAPDATVAGSLAALTAAEQATLATWFPHLRTTFDQLRVQRAPKLIAISSPFDQ